jgi:hypothetical protein
MTYSVSFLSAASSWEVSRFFSTLRAARKWASWLASQPYATKVAIHRGGVGGELIA